MSKPISKNARPTNVVAGVNRTEGEYPEGVLLLTQLDYKEDQKRVRILAINDPDGIFIMYEFKLNNNLIYVQDSMFEKMMGDEDILRTFTMKEDYPLPGADSYKTIFREGILYIAGNEKLLMTMTMDDVIHLRSVTPGDPSYDIDITAARTGDTMH